MKQKPSLRALLRRIENTGPGQYYGWLTYQEELVIRKALKESGFYAEFAQECVAKGVGGRHAAHFEFSEELIKMWREMHGKWKVEGRRT